MVRFNDEALVQIEPVRIVAMMTGIERHCIITALFRFPDNIVEQLPAVPFPSILRQGAEVIDIKRLTAEKHREVSVSRESDGSAFLFNVNDAESLWLHSSKHRHQIPALQMRPQFKDHIGTLEKLCICAYPS